MGDRGADKMLGQELLPHFGTTLLLGCCAMRDQNGWSISLGQWNGVQLRLHIFFPLAIVSTLYLCWLSGQLGSAQGLIWLALLSVAVLTISVAVHVMGHLYAASRLERRIDSIVFSPWGDFATRFGGGDAQSFLIVMAAGPAVNLLVALVCTSLLMVTETPHVTSLLHPFAPGEIASGATWQVTLKLALWTNWMLAVVNLIPASLFDGGAAAGALLHLLFPSLGARRRQRLLTRTALAAGVALLLAAWLMRGDTTQLVPAWLAPCMLAVIVLFSAQQRPLREYDQRLPDDEGPFGYDFSQGYTSLHRSSERQLDEPAEPDASPLERWLDAHRRARQQRQEQLEAEEDALVDEILARVHEEGIASLTLEERALLQRVSMRYRTRMHD